MDNKSQDLPENQFIREGYSQNPYPVWIWLFILCIFIAVISGIASWYTKEIASKKANSPFLQVTNREFSLFLWQNPAFMRTYARNKSGYLPGFQYLDKVSVEVELADAYVVAPPEVLFYYHTWSRLVAHEFNERLITSEEFEEFLQYAVEWQPKNWPKAPEGYQALIESLKSGVDKALNVLPQETLPLEVKIAFQGWKNYFREGEEINFIQPTFGEMNAFLAANPHYARSYWRNIVGSEVPDYLRTLTFGKFKNSDIIPSKELTPFLKVAFFNYLQASKGR